MSRIRSFVAPAITALVVCAPLSAQAAPSEFRDIWQGHFDGSAQKFVALAEAMPAEAYGWSPMEGTMSVVEVYMHIARYNYMYLDQNMGIDAPVPYTDLETDVTDKGEAVEILAASMDHVRAAVAAMTDAQLGAPTTLYGSEVANWAVLFQLVAHMNEHLGQSIAYARSNGVVPPWSR